MYDILAPSLLFASANLAAMSRFALAPGEDTARVAEFWYSALQNHARFIDESTQQMLGTLARLSSRGEQVARQLAHATMRTMAIAIQVRRKPQDRRVFSLQIPGDRRSDDERRQNPPRPALPYAGA